MALFKAVKKPVIKAAAGGADISSLRPRYIAKTPPCAGGCSDGTDIRELAGHHRPGGSLRPHQRAGYRLAWEKMTDRNPFPAVCGRVCPHPCEDDCNRNEKDGAVAINALEQFIGDFGLAQG